MQKRTPLQIFRTVWFALVMREVQALLGRRRWGLFWILFEPLAHLVAMTVVMSIIRDRGDVAGHPFPVFMIVGLAPFLVYRRMITRMAEGIGAGRGLFVYKQITPFDTFLARVFVDASITAAVYVLIVLGFVWYGWDLTMPHPIEWAATLALGVGLAFGLGLVLAAVVNALPDAMLVIRMIFMPLYILSGIIIPPSHMPPRMLEYVMWNPFLHLSELTHTYALTNYVPVYGISAGYVVAWALVSLCLGMALYRAIRFRLLVIRG